MMRKWSSEILSLLGAGFLKKILSDCRSSPGRNKWECLMMNSGRWGRPLLPEGPVFLFFCFRRCAFHRLAFHEDVKIPAFRRHGVTKGVFRGGNNLHDEAAAKSFA